MTAEQSFVERCRAYLEQRWDYVAGPAFQADPHDFILDDEVKTLISSSLTSQSKSYHYVLLTQVLCKIVDPSLDARSLQVSWGEPGAFDARTVAHEVIVPFDKANHNILGGSSEPYVNNPLRVPAVIQEQRNKQKEKTGWDVLVRLLGMVEQRDEAFRKALFDQMLLEIYRLLLQTTFTYPTPNRISLKGTRDILETYLATRSGGERYEIVCTALFQTIGREFGMFDGVRREKVNVADASSGMSADIECWSEGKVALLVEVKDRTLTLTQLDAKIDTARARKITELLFIAEKGKEQSDRNAIEERVEREFAVGQNVYILNLFEFAYSVLVLLGESGRVEFLRSIGAELDRSNAAYAHRKEWMDLLRQA